ncbi:restriction endonuclease [Demequina sp.]|uniref:McrC family protein n=1 Tax=Demequina sp. TaxID=2050685 RepID=UPI0025C019D6|nr:restriction endonuclease [Demequina sp.]
MTHSIVLDELDSHGPVVHLSQDAVASLESTELVEFRPRVGGGYEVLPRGNVGAVRLGDLQIEVRPKDKVGVAQLLFLLGYTRDPGFRLDDIGGTTDEHLLSALAESLARQARRAIARGVHHAYVSVDEAARTVRGRIRIGDQITRRPGLLVPLEVTYDDYSPDVPENQILRSAVRLMARLPQVGERVRTELSIVDAQLDGVRVIEHGRPLPQWVPTRLNLRYHNALRLSEIVLRHQSASTTAGDVEMAAFVVPMWKVFEDFVGTALRTALSSTRGETREQYPVNLDVRPSSLPAVHMDVDIVHLMRGVPVVVADAKYKAESASGKYPNADKYQMLAYCTALGLERGWLIYARGDRGPGVRRIVNTGIEIVEWPIDLSVEPRAILAQVDELASAMAGSASSTGRVAIRT